MDQSHFLAKDYFFMKEALLEAKKGFEEEEIPVGAVIVYKGKIIARAYNQIESLKDPTAHAELLCIRSAAQMIGDWRLLQTTLYSTLEPCSMCMGALFLARISKIIWGAPDIRHGALGSWVNLLEKKHATHLMKSQGGLMKQEAAALMQTFFRGKREQLKK